MALLWMDGFETYGASGASGTALNTELQKVYDYALTTDSSPDNSLQVGWRGGLALNYIDNDTDDFLRKNFVAPGTTLIVGFAFKKGTIHTSNYILTWSSDNNQQQASLHLDTYGRIQITSRNIVTDRVDEPLRHGEWYYIEWKLFCDHAVGTSEVRINGQTVLTIPAHDSYYNALPTRLKIHSQKNTAVSYTSIDDLYVCNTSGSAPFNDFLGPMKMELLAPTSDDTAEWTPSAAVSHYTLVDEMPDDGDTTYVEAELFDDTDLFGYADTSFDDVTMVQVQTRAKNEDVGTLYDLALVCDTGTEETDTREILTTSYTTELWFMETAPGGGAWSSTTINAAKFGFKVG